jgi:hypothetical protein
MGNRHSDLTDLNQEQYFNVITCFRKMRENSENGYTVKSCQAEADELVKVFGQLGYKVKGNTVKWDDPKEPTASYKHIDPAINLHATATSPETRAKVFAEAVKDCEKSIESYGFDRIEARSRGLIIPLPYCSVWRLTDDEKKKFLVHFEEYEPELDGEETHIQITNYPHYW